MTDQRKNFQEAAMRYGTVMGIFWTLKFVLFPLGMQSPLLLMAFFLLTLIVPVAGFFLVRQYRDRECNGVLTFSRGFLFTSFIHFLRRSPRNRSKNKIYKPLRLATIKPKTNLCLGN